MKWLNMVTTYPNVMMAVLMLVAIVAMKLAYRSDYVAKGERIALEALCWFAALGMFVMLVSGLVGKLWLVLIGICLIVASICTDIRESNTY